MGETESSGAHGWLRSPAIIGAGAMGLGVAESFAVAGTAVRLT
jgi:3-hydroxyacyl-CoA dehydrogenase